VTKGRKPINIETRKARFERGRTPSGGSFQSLGVDVDEKLIRALEFGKQVVLVRCHEDRADRDSHSECRRVLAEVAETSEGPVLIGFRRGVDPYDLALKEFLRSSERLPEQNRGIPQWIGPESETYVVHCRQHGEIEIPLETVTEAMKLANATGALAHIQIRSGRLTVC
jgi:hypothetical protein